MLVPVRVVHSPLAAPADQVEAWLALNPAELGRKMLSEFSWRIRDLRVAIGSKDVRMIWPKVLPA